MPRPRSLNPIAVFLSSSELGMASHPRPVFSGASFPSHTSQSQSFRIHIHDQLSHAVHFHVPQGNFGEERWWWWQAPHPTQFGPDPTKQRRRGRANERMIGRKRWPQLAFSNTRWPVEGFLKCLGKDISPHPHSCPFQIRFPNICWSTSYLSVAIMKTVWGGTLSAVSSLKYHALLPQGQYN